MLLHDRVPTLRAAVEQFCQYRVAAGKISRDRARTLLEIRAAVWQHKTCTKIKHTAVQLIPAQPECITSYSAAGLQRSVV